MTVSSLQIIPVQPTDNPCDLIGAVVQAHYWRDEYFHQLFIGEVLDVRESWEGTSVLFSPQQGQRNLPVPMTPRWLPASFVVGAVFYGEPTDIDPETQTQTALTVS